MAACYKIPTASCSEKEKAMEIVKGKWLPEFTAREE